MPSRIFPFLNEYFYHIYNRGSEKRTIFESRRDYQRFLKTLKYYQLEGPKPRFSRFPSPLVKELDESKKIVKIVAYCLMPNHFHILLTPTKDGCITEFMSKVSNSYTKYYNTKYGRVGPLLQGEFKAVIMESDEQMIHVSRYIHLNPLASGIIKGLDQYRWSSYPEYTGNTHVDFCFKEQILQNFKNSQNYQQFVLDQASYAQELEMIKHQLIDQV
ncbi:MAG: transposase [Patescibacteria group bacterium]|nr:transposase [Patescibacteria group bacterium]